MLDENNPYVKIYRMAGDRIQDTEDTHFQIKLIGNKISNGRDYNLPTASEIAILIVVILRVQLKNTTLLFNLKEAIYNK